MICSSRAVPSVATTSACVSPRVKSPEPWVRGSTPVRMVIGRTVRVSRPSMRGFAGENLRWRTILALDVEEHVLERFVVHLRRHPGRGVGQPGP